MLAGGLVDTAVVHARGPDLDRPGRGDHGPGQVVAVADHQPPPVIVGLSRQLGYVLVDFRFQSGSQHAAGALADDLVDQGAELGGTVVGDYAEHGHTFPTRAANAGYSVTITGSFGKVRLPRALLEAIHKS